MNLYLFSAKKSSNRKLLQKSNDISSSLHFAKIKCAPSSCCANGFLRSNEPKGHLQCESVVDCENNSTVKRKALDKFG